MREAERTPVTRPVDPKKLARKPFFKAERKKGKLTVPTIVSVPESESETQPSGIIPMVTDEEITTKTVTQHTEIQYHLLKLGSEMGLNIWVARNDRSKTWSGETLGSIKGMVAELPTQFNEVTNRTIELIDVLWLRGNSIVAAFEIEYTTAIYSGLLRMSDLLALQPNIDIRLILLPQTRGETRLSKNCFVQPLPSGKDLFRRFVDFFPSQHYWKVSVNSSTQASYCSFTFQGNS
jgi:hypothetical protein